MPETNFFWDPLSDNILQERDDAGALTAEYTTEPGLYGNLISQNRGGTENQYHFDAQGSTLALTDDHQQVTDTGAYTAFGEVAERTGTTEVPFQYIGQKGYYRDEETGECIARRRPLFPSTGRWLSVEPLEGRDLGSYYYVQNDPIQFVDPSGLIKASLPKKTRPEYELRLNYCGGYTIPIEFSVTRNIGNKPTTRIAVVMKLCFSGKTTFCVGLPCYPFSEGCPYELCTISVGDCCIFEAFALTVDTKLAVGDPLPYQDAARNGAWTPPNACPSSKGWFKRTAEVRMFHLTQDDFDPLKFAPNFGKKWKTRFDPVKCSYYGFRAATWREEPPDFWDAPVEEGEINGDATESRLISQGKFDIGTDWNCCIGDKYYQNLYAGSGDLGDSANLRREIGTNIPGGPRFQGIPIECGAKL